jgi:DNA-binding transcriptional regulator YdaS (Cro superfamily)
MNLSQYLSEERGRLTKLAKAIGAHPPDVYKWSTGERPIPIRFGASIELKTGGMVTRREMFPEVWQTIWPELATKESPNRGRRRPQSVSSIAQ